MADPINPGKRPINGIDPAAAPSAEARRLIWGMIDAVNAGTVDRQNGGVGDEKREYAAESALLAYVAGLEAEVGRLRESGQRQAADFHAAMCILNQDIGFVGSHWEAWPDPSAGYWPNLCVHVSSFGADAEEVRREHWQLLAKMVEKHGEWAGEAYACWRRGTDKPEKGDLPDAGRAALAEFRQFSAAQRGRAAEGGDLMNGNGG